MPRRFKYLKRCLIALAICVGLLSLARWQWGRVMHNRLETVVKAIEATGEPIRFGDMTFEAVADVDNAAYYYKQALANWPRLANGELITETDWHMVSGPHDDPIKDNTAYLEQCQAVIELLRKASDAPGCNWKGQLTSPIANQSFQHLGEMRQVAYLIKDTAQRATAESDYRTAVELTHQLLNLAESVNQPQHLLIDCLIATSIRAMALVEIEEKLPEWSLASGQSRVPVERGQFETLIHRLTDDSYHENYLRAWIHDRWWSYDAIESIFDGRLSIYFLRYYFSTPPSQIQEQA